MKKILGTVKCAEDAQFLLPRSDGRVRFWCKKYEMDDNDVDPSCLVSTVQAGSGDVMMCRIFSWHTSAPN